MIATLSHRSPTLRGVIPNPARFLGRATLAALLLAGWTALTAPHAASAASSTTHAKLCKCAHCPGEALCCCGKKKAPDLCPR